MVAGRPFRLRDLRAQSGQLSGRAYSDGSGPPREILGGDRAIDLVRLTRSGDRLFFALTDARHLHEIHTLTLGDRPGGAAGEKAEPRRLTGLGDGFLAGRSLAVPEKVVARNGAGQEVEGFLYPPLRFDPAKTYPLILYVHGGPEGYDGHFFDSSLENQLFPAAGMAVLRCNYRGSTSYGEAFVKPPYGNWHFPGTRGPHGLPGRGPAHEGLDRP